MTDDQQTEREELPDDEVAPDVTPVEPPQTETPPPPPPEAPSEAPSEAPEEATDAAPSEAPSEAPQGATARKDARHDSKDDPMSAAEFRARALRRANMGEVLSEDERSVVTAASVEDPNLTYTIDPYGFPPHMVYRCKSCDTAIIDSPSATGPEQMQVHYYHMHVPKGDAAGYPASGLILDAQGRPIVG